MARNQYQGREETDKINFGKMSIEEQREYSKKHINPNEQEETSLNEKIAEQEKIKSEKEQSKRIH